MRESVRKFTKTYREGGKYDEAQLDELRTMLVDSGQEPAMVDLFLKIFHDEIFASGAKKMGREDEL